MIDYTPFLKILLAALLGGLIGFERELSGKPAGLRTHMLVAIASSLAIVIGESLLAQHPALTGADPTRLLYAMIVGISFLGAGTIIQRERGTHIEGLTTAASVLVTVIIGAAIAVDEYALAAAVTLLVLLIVYALGKAEDWFEEKGKRRRKL